MRTDGCDFLLKSDMFLKALEKEELRHLTLMISGSVFCLLVPDNLGGVFPQTKRFPRQIWR
jgi:hypothetical protein